MFAKFTVAAATVVLAAAVALPASAQTLPKQTSMTISVPNAVKTPSALTKSLSVTQVRPMSATVNVPKPAPLPTPKPQLKR